MKSCATTQSSPITANKPHRDILHSGPAVQHLGGIALGRKEQTIRETPCSYKGVNHIRLQFIITGAIPGAQEPPDFLRRNCNSYRRK